MSKAIKYIENLSILDEDDIETVTLNEAITACELQELTTIEYMLECINTDNRPAVTIRIEELRKKLRNIKTP